MKCFDKINENVGVHRAPVRSRHSGRARNSGRKIFEKENLMTRKIKELNQASPGFGSDSPFASDRAWGRYNYSTKLPTTLLKFMIACC